MLSGGIERVHWEQMGQVVFETKSFISSENIWKYPVRLW